VPESLSDEGSARRGGWAYVMLELELDLTQTQMAQKPLLRAELYARALRASQR
jgi:hypothetical protein